MYSFLIVEDILLLNINTIIYTICLSIIGILNISYVLATNCIPERVKYLYLLGAVAIHIGLLLGFRFAGHEDNLLWMTDSYDFLVPGAINVANYFYGVEELQFTMGPHGAIYLTQVWVGIFFYCFGVSPIISSIALLIPKILTTYLIYVLAKKLFNSEKVALIALLIYSLMPTIIFYTTTFYKESIVQLLVVFTLLCMHCVFNENKKSYIFGIIIGVVLLINERFYVAVFLLMALFLQIILSWDSITLRMKVIYSSVFAICAAIVINLYNLTSISFILSEIENARNAYLKYDDVTIVNKEIPYFIAVIKITFTPYFTLNKFTLFSGYAYLLIWGSFINQLVILLSLFGIYINIKKSLRGHFFVLITFSSIILFFAYIAPYSGRIRDSIYPIIAIYSGYFIYYLYIKYSKKIIQ